MVVYINIYHTVSVSVTEYWLKIIYNLCNSQVINYFNWDIILLGA